MIASNKQKEYHNSLTTIQKVKLKGAHERSKRLQFVRPKTQMQTLTRMNKEIIKDDYHVITMNKNKN